MTVSIVKIQIDVCSTLTANEICGSEEIAKQRYTEYIYNHKYNVMVAGKRFSKYLAKDLDIDQDQLLNLLKEHDRSKYQPLEFNAYRRKWFPTKAEIEQMKQLKEIYIKVKDDFDLAWTHHYSVNPHHPEFWIRPSGVEPMPKIFIAEMLCDWAAMSMQFHSSTEGWYCIQTHRDLPLHPDTAKIVESIFNTKYWAAFECSVALVNQMKK